MKGELGKDFDNYAYVTGNNVVGNTTNWNIKVWEKLLVWEKLFADYGKN